jgi:hypothetical protein
MHNNAKDRGSFDHEMKETWGKLLGVLAKTNSYRADPMRREITFVVAMLTLAAQEWQGRDRMPPYEKGSMLSAYVLAGEGRDPNTDAIYMSVEDILAVIDEKLVTEHGVEISVKHDLT